ncbi:MAG: hypothetical protein ACXACH_03810, partial [Candidatus Hermodarchaeia archaeon]
MLQNITEHYADVFENARMTNGVVRGVSILGRKSQNNRTYSDQALRDVAQLANGAKSFLNHITKAERQDRGIRSVRDWLGIFENTRKEGNRVRGDLRVRESFRPLVSDIISLTPKGIGLSIDGKAKCRKTDDGSEVVENVVGLRE